MRHLVLVFAGSSLLFFAGCTNAPSDDIGRSTYNICCGANCCCPSIGTTGSAFNAGDVNPDNECEICDPAMTAMAWSPNPACDDAGPGMMGTDAGPGMTGTDAGDGGGGDDGGCSVGHRGAPAGGAFAVFSVVAALLVWRRRR